MDEKTLIIEIKDQYGVPMYHPVNEIAKLFCSLTGKKTISADAVVIIKKLGYEIKTEGKIL